MAWGNDGRRRLPDGRGGGGETERPVNGDGKRATAICGVDGGGSRADGVHDGRRYRARKGRDGLGWGISGSGGWRMRDDPRRWI
ncbi:hypothetical protein E2562_035859 [Oryza meyeriana var. granulata]|uniref:Uncharacterized protein n=1 Tax=Oryza meyeriana var. granulata TaxID=110450 RepID=A0A6G1CWY4_9ORYZ|nr:hypothetical protein E2562_035859 [Oryza meyeriana var. granulata]